MISYYTQKFSYLVTRKQLKHVYVCSNASDSMTSKFAKIRNHHEIIFTVMLQNTERNETANKVKNECEKHSLIL